MRELESFARTLSWDCWVVAAALRYEWSQGQVEGQINRLKLIKKRMYERANFDLLRQRVPGAEQGLFPGEEAASLTTFRTEISGEPEFYVLDLEPTATIIEIR